MTISTCIFTGGNSGIHQAHVMVAWLMKATIKASNQMAALLVEMATILQLVIRINDPQFKHHMFDQLVSSTNHAAQDGRALVHCCLLSSW